MDFSKHAISMNSEIENNPPLFLSLFQGTFLATETRPDWNKVLGLSSYSHRLEGNSKSPESWRLFLGKCEANPPAAAKLARDTAGTLQMNSTQ